VTQLPARPTIGLLALTLELYETLAPDLRRQREQWVRRQLLPRLEETAVVLFDRAVSRREDVETALRGVEAAGADALLVLLLTYAPSQIALGPLRATRLPIVVWNTQELFAVDEQFSPDAMSDNHGVHGTQDLANVLLRAGVPFHYVTSHPSDADGLVELQDFFAAAAAVARLRRCRLGLMGNPFPGMGDFAVDTSHLAATLGCCWESLSVAEYNRRAADASEQQTRRLQEEYRQSYDLASDLTESDLSACARAELALRSLVDDRCLDAMSFQFLAFGEDPQTETLPFVAVSRMMADGVGFAGEGDLVGAANTWFLNRLCGPASFSEIFTIDFAGNGLLLSHMGEANVALARKDRKMRLAARPVPITRTRGRQLALVNCFEPGPATLCALTLGPNHRWRLIASRVEIEDFGPLPALPVPHTKIRCAGNVRGWLTSYAKTGGPHHHAICFGDARPRLQIAARLLDADYCEV
jgi:L-arabinose isomerase